MKKIDSLKIASKPGLLTMAIILAVAIIFASINFYFDYQQYLQTYQTTQANEINRLRDKEVILQKALKSYLRLTEARVIAAEGDDDRLQRIIKSVTHLKINQHLFPFEKVSFYNASESKRQFNRIGINCLDSKVRRSISSIKEQVFVWEHETIAGRLYITIRDQLYGVLEIKIGREVLNNYFNPLSSIRIFHNEGSIQFYKEPPQTFWAIVKENKHRYTIFCILSLVVCTLLAVGIYFTSIHIRKKYFQYIQELDEALSTSRQQVDELQSKLSDSKDNMQNFVLSRQSHLKLQTAINQRQKQRATWINQSLDVIKQSYQNPQLYISEQNQLDIIQQCQKEAYSLSMGLGKSKGKVNIDLKNVVSNILQLFSEKTYKSNISVDIKLPMKPCSIVCDPLLIEVLFTNIVGQAIHRVPKKGVISISLKEIEKGFLLRIVDNGYDCRGSADKLIKKSFDLFLNDDNFLDICEENDLKYTYKKEADGLSTSCLILPIQEEEVIKNNVVKLFKN